MRKHIRYYDDITVRISTLNYVKNELYNNKLSSDSVDELASIIADGISYSVTNGLNIISSIYKAIAADIYTSRIYINDPAEYKEELDNHILEITIRSHNQAWGPDRYLDVFIDSDYYHCSFVITKDDLSNLFNIINSNLTTDEIAYMLLHNIDLNSLYCFATTAIK